MRKSKRTSDDLKKRKKRNNDIEIQSIDLLPTKRKNILIKDIMYIFPNKKKWKCNTMISKSFGANSIFHRWGVQRITYRESMGGWYGCFVGFPVINMPRMMPCVSTIPPKPSDRTIGSTTAPLYISLSSPLTSLCLPFCFALTFCLRSWEYTEAIRNSIRSPWRDTAVYWTGPRHGGASHFLPREILGKEERRLSWPWFASIDSPKSRERLVFFLLCIYCIRPRLLVCVSVYSLIIMNFLYQSFLFSNRTTFLWQPNKLWLSFLITCGTYIPLYNLYYTYPLYKRTILMKPAKFSSNLIFNWC